jgi:O-antigen/teichoic acid export membrane protein
VKGPALAAKSRALAFAALDQPWLQRLAADTVLHQFLRGTSTAFFIGVAGRFVSFPITISLARILGTENFGRYIYVTNWLGILLVLGTLGFNTSLLRFVPAYHAQEEWGLLRGFLRRAPQIVLFLTLTLSAALATFVLTRGDLDKGLALTFLAGCLVLPLQGQAMLREAWLRAINRLALSEGLGQVARPAFHALAVLGLFLVLRRTISSQTAMLLRATVDLTALVFTGWVLNRAMTPRIRSAQPLYRTREWIRVSFPLSLVSGMLLLMSNIDVIIVGTMLGPSAAGVYAVAANLARFTTFGLVASDTAAQPMIAALHSRGDRDGLRRLVAALVWISALLAAVTGLALLVLHRPLLGLFGGDFVGGAAVMMILTAGRVLNALTGPSGSLLAMTSHQDTNALILAASVVVNVAATIAGTALLGMTGAALGATTTLTLMTLWTWIEVRRRLGINASVFARPPSFGG